MILQIIFRDSNYSLNQFPQDCQDTFEKTIFEKETRGKLGYYAKCLIRDKDIKLTPEEVVRQLYLMVLLDDY
jgi:type I restriction enzyme M protein